MNLLIIYLINQIEINYVLLLEMNDFNKISKLLVIFFNYSACCPSNICNLKAILNKSVYSSCAMHYAKIV